MSKQKKIKPEQHYLVCTMTDGVACKNEFPLRATSMRKAAKLYARIHMSADTERQIRIRVNCHNAPYRPAAAKYFYISMDVVTRACVSVLEQPEPVAGPSGFLVMDADQEESDLEHWWYIKADTTQEAAIQAIKEEYADIKNRDIVVIPDLGKKSDAVRYKVSVTVTVSAEPG